MTKGKVWFIILGLSLIGALTIDSTNPLWILIYAGFMMCGTLLGTAVVSYIIDNWDRKF